MDVESVTGGGLYSAPFEKFPHDLVVIRVEAENQDEAWEKAKEMIFLHMVYTMPVKSWMSPRMWGRR